MESRKITTPSKPTVKRRYDDACGLALGLDFVGERWALHVIRELMLGPKRFSELRTDLPGISANVLTQRLEGLEASGILVRRKLPPPSGAQVYELTPWGYEAEPIIQTLGRWAVRSPLHDATLPLSAVSMMLSLRTMLDRSRAQGMDARVGFRFGSEEYVGHISGEGLPIRRGNAEEADVVFSGTPTGVAAAVYGNQALEALEAAGLLRVEGDKALAERFVGLFGLPEKIAAA